MARMRATRSAPEQLPAGLSLKDAFQLVARVVPKIAEAIFTVASGGEVVIKDKLLEKLGIVIVIRRK